MRLHFCHTRRILFFHKRNARTHLRLHLAGTHFLPAIPILLSPMKPSSLPRLKLRDPIPAIRVVLVRPLQHSGQPRIPAKHLLPSHRGNLVVVATVLLRGQKLPQLGFEHEKRGLGERRVEKRGRRSGGKMGVFLDGGVQRVKEGKRREGGKTRTQ